MKLTNKDVAKLNLLSYWSRNISGKYPSAVYDNEVQSIGNLKTEIDKFYKDYPLYFYTCSCNNGLVWPRTGHYMIKCPNYMCGEKYSVCKTEHQSIRDLPVFSRLDEKFRGSSMLDRITGRLNEKGEVENVVVYFHTGSAEYDMIPYCIWRNWTKCSSPGKFYSNEIRYRPDRGWGNEDVAKV